MGIITNITYYNAITFQKMGNQKSKNTTRIEIFLQESYKYLDLDFSAKEMTAFNLKLADAEKYFFAKFTFIYFFNTTIFTENFSTLYDNFNNKVEDFSKESAHKLFNLLIEFDDESETISFGGKVEFDTLFAIIFEKLEIHLIISFDLTSCEIPYISELTSQLYENASLYKCNRQYDCIYFLLPNTDYFIKNSSSLTYTSNNKQGIFYKNNEEMLSLLLLKKFRKKFLQTKKDDSLTYSYYEKVIEKISPVHCFVFTYVNNLNEEDNISSLLELLFLIIQNSLKVVLCVLINKKNDFPSKNNFAVIMERILSLFEKEEKLKEFAIKICLSSNDFRLSQSYYDESIRVIRNKLSNRNDKKLKFSVEISQINHIKSSSREYATLKYTCEQIDSSIEKPDKIIILFVLKHAFNDSIYKANDDKSQMIMKNIISFYDNNKGENLKEKRNISKGTILKEDFKSKFILKDHFLF